MPLTSKGQTILSAMTSEYGPEKGKRVFYASRNAGKIKGVDVPHRAGGGGLAGLENIFNPNERENLFGRGGEGLAGGLGGLFSGGRFAGGLGNTINDILAAGGGSSGINMPFGPGRPGMPPVALPMSPSAPNPQPLSPVGHTAPGPSQQTPAGPTNQFAAGGGAQMPWFARNEARSMLHTGPIKSPVAGRTDHIPLKVPGGSYVLPADHISHLGENNTDAGMARASHMFGTTGPFGSNLPKVVHGRGAPSAPPVPRPPVLSRSLSHTTRSVFSRGGGGNYQGGVQGNDDEPVDIMAAGGEFVIHPAVVREIGNGNLDHGHQILDRWVMQERKKHQKTLAGLPPPAK
jgi:hypothetical protein